MAVVAVRSARIAGALGRWIPVATLLGLAALAVPVALQASDHDRRAAERSAAVAAARTEVTNLLTISYATARRDLDRIVAGATGRLARQFAIERQHLQALTQGRSVTSGTVLSAALVQLDSKGDRARVSVAADARVATGTGPSVVKRYRWLVTLRLVRGRWLASDAALAGVPQ